MMQSSLPYHVYILSNYARTVFYTGVTNNLRARVWEHRNNLSVFTSTYRCDYLMYYESYQYILDAIAREKQLKKWRREWKIALIRKTNPELIDLAADWFKERC